MEKNDKVEALEMEGLKPNLWKGAYYGNQYVPSPTNSAAKIVHKDAIMKAVNEGK